MDVVGSLKLTWGSLDVSSLEVNQHFKNSGSFWKMLPTPTKIMVGNQPIRNGGNPGLPGSSFHGWIFQSLDIQANTKTAVRYDWTSKNKPNKNATKLTSVSVFAWMSRVLIPFMEDGIPELASS